MFFTRFSLICIPIRVIYSCIPLFAPISFLNFFAFVTFAQSITYIYQHFFAIDRLVPLEEGINNIWKDFRIIHAGLFFSCTILLIKDRRIACIPLFFSTVLGMIYHIFRLYSNMESF